MARVRADRVKETSTSTGTGAFTLSGAVTSFRQFSAVCATNDTVGYLIEAVDAVGAPTGDWEVGVGTYSSANTLTRTTVVASSNAGAAVDFAAGTKRVSLTFLAQEAAYIREKLTAPRTYYVRTDGNDNNDGLSNAAGGAFLTIQKAVNVAIGTLDTNTYDVTIQIADGTYSATGSNSVVIVKGNLFGGGQLTLQGNTTTPSNVVLSAASGHCIQVTGNLGGPAINIKGMKVTSTSGYGVIAGLNGGGGAAFLSSFEFGACGANQARATGTNSLIDISGSITVSGNAGQWLQADSQSYIQLHDATVTFSGTLTYSTRVVTATLAGVFRAFTITWAGTYASVVGTKYLCELNSVMQLNGVTIPGNTGGSALSGGQVG